MKTKSQIYSENRGRITDKELKKHIGKIVAFSEDGSRVVASHEDFGELVDLVEEKGEDPENVGFEWIEEEDIVGIGGLDMQDLT